MIILYSFKLLGLKGRKNYVLCIFLKFEPCLKLEERKKQPKQGEKSYILFFYCGLGWYIEIWILLTKFNYLFHFIEKSKKYFMIYALPMLIWKIKHHNRSTIANIIELSNWIQHFPRNLQNSNCMTIYTIIRVPFQQITTRFQEIPNGTISIVLVTFLLGHIEH